MQKILIKLGLWLIKQEWFQFAVVKFITAKIENTENKVDDKLLDFIKEHKRSISTIAKKELSNAESVIDERFTKAVKSLKSAKSVKPVKTK